MVSRYHGPASQVALAYLARPTTDELGAVLRSLLISVRQPGNGCLLGGVVGPGQTVVIKPNLVRHFNPRGSIDAVITSPRVVRVLVELAAEAVGPTGRVIVADSPQNDCDFEELLAHEGWQELLRWAHAELGPAFQVLDMRPERVVMQDGVIVARHSLTGDPRGEKKIDLGAASAFAGSEIDPARLRGSDYDPSVTASSHSTGSHTYSLCNTFLEADLLIVVPKVKTHKKVGLSLAMKNLVGTVGEKNCLPHHTAGFPRRGGDEYPDRSLRAVVRQWGVERARPFLARGWGLSAMRMVRRIERVTFAEIPGRSGNWWGNDTAWRMALDLVTVLRQERRDRNRPTLFVYDGVIAGEGEGPLAPDPVDLRLLAVADDPVAGDVAVANEVGVSANAIPLLREAVARAPWGRGSVDARVEVLQSRAGEKVALRLHPGWVDAPGLTMTP